MSYDDRLVFVYVYVCFAQAFQKTCCTVRRMQDIGQLLGSSFPKTVEAREALQKLGPSPEIGGRKAEPDA